MKRIEENDRSQSVRNNKRFFRLTKFRLTQTIYVCESIICGRKSTQHCSLGHTEYIIEDTEKRYTHKSNVPYTRYIFAENTEIFANSLFNLFTNQKDFIFQLKYYRSSIGWLPNCSTFSQNKYMCTISTYIPMLDRKKFRSVHLHLYF